MSLLILYLESIGIVTKRMSVGMSCSLLLTGGSWRYIAPLMTLKTRTVTRKIKTVREMISITGIKMLTGLSSSLL